MVNPGILPLSIVRGVQFSSIVLQCKDEKVTVSGTLSPDVTGLFVPSGTYNGYPIFILEGTPSTFLYVNPVEGGYVIARLLTDGALTDYWSPASQLLDDPTGSYVPHGANTGTAAVTDNPVDLTGYTAVAEGRRVAGAPDVIVDFNPSITDAVNGEITIPAMTKTQTAALDYTGMFNWDLVLVDNTGERLGPFVKGALSISDNVTQITHA